MMWSAIVSCGIGQRELWLEPSELTKLIQPDGLIPAAEYKRDIQAYEDALIPSPIALLGAWVSAPGLHRMRRCRYRFGQGST